MRYLALLLLVACSTPAPAPTPAPTPAPAAIPAERPTIPASSPYDPPVPEAADVPPFSAARLLERPGLDLVSLRVVVPMGASADPEGRSGLAALTAEMMEQGAGELDGFALALAAERIGADIAVEARQDYSVASVDIVASQLEPALALLADVILRPRFDADEWARSKELWLGDLDARGFQPRRVAGIIGDAALYGRDRAYGRPVDGFIADVKATTLEDVRGFHRQAWRVDGATLVAVGRVSATALRAAVGKAFTDLPPVDGPVAAQRSPQAPTKAWPRFTVFDNPSAPQTVLRLSWPGPTMDADNRAELEIVDFVLGGSFTSRLNNNLREDKGYTYGARSRLPVLRGAGPFTAGASVQTEVTAKALKELLAELEGIAAKGLTEEEIGKAKASLRNDDVQTYETVAGAADRLALLAGLGLPGRYDAHAAAARRRADEDSIREAARFFFGDRAQITAVGAVAAIEDQLKAEGIDLGPPQIRGPEGR